MGTAARGEGPLSGRKVVVTRASGQSGGAGLLAEAGAEVLEFPTIRTVAPEDTGELDAAIKGLDGYDYAIFTSFNAVRFFLRRMGELGRGVNELSGLRVVSVGPKTADSLMKAGITPDVVPEDFRAEGVVDTLSAEDVAGKRFLFPRAETAREVVPDRLRERGAVVDVVTAYRTVVPDADPAELIGLFEEGGIDAVTFTSSSTVTNFVAIVGERAVEYLSGACVACIGPVTAKTCEEMGIAVSVMPGEYTVDALYEALVKYFSKETE